MLLGGLVSNIFQFFQGLEVCVERFDSYDNFGSLERKSQKKILGKFCKRTHCPPDVTLGLVFFLGKSEPSDQRKSWAKLDLQLGPVFRRQELLEKRKETTMDLPTIQADQE